MPIMRHADVPLYQRRPGYQARRLISKEDGAASTYVGLSYVQPGSGAPSHTHPVEETLVVLKGRAHVWMGEEECDLGPETTILVPAGVVHGFRSSGPDPLVLLTFLPINEFLVHPVDDRRGAEFIPPPDAVLV
jgi:mannose-6-phosphate isomerase-like protein (cupin superfamily)